MNDEQFLAELNRMARELASIRQLVTQVVSFIRDAESEVPEKLRRFMNYMHDLHDIRYMYEELGAQMPDHQRREMERCDDRFRQIMKDMHKDGGILEKVRREMAADPENRYDHTRRLFPPTETKDEAMESKPKL
jgi:septation ring formation regulator EzrA